MIGVYPPRMRTLMPTPGGVGTMYTQPPHDTRTCKRSAGAQVGLLVAYMHLKRKGPEAPADAAWILRYPLTRTDTYRVGKPIILGPHLVGNKIAWKFLRVHTRLFKKGRPVINNAIAAIEQILRGLFAQLYSGKIRAFLVHIYINEPCCTELLVDKRAGLPAQGKN